MNDGIGSLSEPGAVIFEQRMGMRIFREIDADAAGSQTVEEIAQLVLEHEERLKKLDGR